MSTLITGGTGFVGLAVAEALLARDEAVVLAAPEPPPPDVLHRLSRLPGRLDVERLDVREADALLPLLRRHAVRHLLPFAAVTAGPEREAAAPELVLEVNLLALVRQLRAARDAGVRRVLLPSSAAAYGETAETRAVVMEDDPCVPSTLYGISKHAAERTGLRLGALWGLDVVAVRLGAVFGPWERDTGLRDTLTPFWQVARLALAGQEAVLPSAAPACSFVYARDAADALLHLLALPEPPHRLFNVGSGRPWGDTVPDWCEHLRAGLPGFTWRHAAPARRPTCPPPPPCPAPRPTSPACAPPAGRRAFPRPGRSATTGTGCWRADRKAGKRFFFKKEAKNFFWFGSEGSTRLI